MRLLIDGKNLKEIRSEVGFKKFEAARRVGISITAYDKWENEVSAPDSDEKIFKLLCFIEEKGYTGDLKTDLE